MSDVPSDNQAIRINSGIGSILIDDREDLRRSWEAKGGLFVHYRHISDALHQLALIDPRVLNCDGWECYVDPAIGNNTDDPCKMLPVFVSISLDSDSQTRIVER